MAETTTKTPVSTESKEAAPAPSGWQPFETLRQEIDRLFDDFHVGFRRSPFRRIPLDLEPIGLRDLGFGATPAVDIVEKDDAYEITAELPGIDEKNIEVKYADGALTIRGEKEEAREEKKKDYHLSERRYGAFRRSFRVPEGTDPEKVQATFKRGVLTVTLPKSPESRKKEKRIAIAAK